MKPMATASLALLVSIGCVEEELEPEAGSEALIIDGPPPLPWTRVSGNPDVKETYVVSAGDLQESGTGQNVLVGYIDLYTDTYSFGSNTGPLAVFHYWHKTRGVYPAVNCTGASNARYDHATIKVDSNCPPAAPGEHNHWITCPIHMMAGWDEGPQVTLLGIWSASSTELHFSWNVNGVKRKDYWFIKKKLPTIHYLELDGTRTNGPDSYSPSERTHGFAAGSNKQFNESVPLAFAMQSFNTDTFYDRTYTWHQGQASTTDGVSGVQYSSCNARSNELWYSFSCYDNLCSAAERHPHTQQCADRGPTFSENLRYWADPWPAASNRKNVKWMWQACHVQGTGSCYHGGSHAFPMLQAVSDTGVFYGWLGIEHQDDSGSDFYDDLLVIRYLRSDLLP